MIFNFFRRRPNLEQISILQILATQAVSSVERPGNGSAKKAEAVQIVGGLAKTLALPVPPVMVDLAVEAAARGLRK